MGFMHYADIFRLENIMQNLGCYVAVSMVAANVVSAMLYVGARVTGRAERMSGFVVHDIFL